MLTSRDAVKMLSSGLKTIFMNNFSSYKSVYPLITSEVTSTKSSEDYGWLGATPQMQEWLDERKVKGLSEYGFSLKNKSYEATIGVDRDTFDDDQYGQIKLRVAGLAATASKGYDRFLATMIESNPICYDGQNFFDTDHAESGANQANLYTSTALTAPNAKTVLTAMKQIKDDTNVIYGVTPTHIVVPAGLEFTARQLFDPQYVSVTTDPSQAVLKGAVSVVVLPFLTSATTHYYIDMSQGVSPFIFQNRKPITFAGDEESFMRKTIVYGVDARFAFGVGDWKLAAKCTA